MNNIALQISNLGHAYKSDRWLFRDYNTQVKRGEVFALLGPNGCGKTTLLKILLGALKPAAGTVAIDGRMAFVPQLFQVTFDYSVMDMVLMGRARQVGLFSQPSAEDEEAAMAALERFGIAHFAGHPFHELSGGERQLVIFARALVSEADILILDEPTSALDLKNQIVVLDWITRLSHQDGLTVLFTTHHPHHALAVADDALLMLGGTKYAAGAASEVLSEDNLHALYGVDIKLLSFEHSGHSHETLVPVLPYASRARNGSTARESR
ncbi:MAG: ABC transporter ATP-binding protein [Acidobacteriota bacterium]|nr:ABC transporter ATP-binding protein [Acidobacteriota bacterium]